MKKRFDYGLILVESLKRRGGGFLNVGTVAKEHKISPAYLEKIAQELKRAGFMESRRGRDGGSRLTKEVSIAELMRFFERPFEFCPIGRLKIKS